MASYNELYNSRIGTTIGIGGAQNSTTTWEVIVDRPTDDPVAMLQRHAVASGQAFPWTGFGVVAKDFVYAEHPSPLLWHIVVIYGPASLVYGTERWSTDISASLETEEVDLDINGLPIGIPVYATLEQILAMNPGNPGVRDPRLDMYDPTPFWSTDDNKPVQLFRMLHTGQGWTPEVPNVDVSRFRLIRTQRTRPAAIMTMSRRIANMPDGKIATALSYLNTLNRATFRGAAKWQLKMTGFDSREVESIVLGQHVTGLAYDVRLTWNWNPLGHQPIRRYHTFKNASGVEAVITGSDQFATPTGAVWTQNDLFDDSDFNGLMSLFPK